MTHNNRMAFAALALAGVALAVSLYSALRGPGAGSGPAAAAGGECVDRTARDQADQLRRALAARDAVVARLVRDGASGGSAAAGEPARAPVPPEPAEPPEPGAGPRRFARFEPANPAVTVTQKPDGSYDIQTRDPGLAGQVVQVKAVTASGDETTMLIRIPSR